MAIGLSVTAMYVGVARAAQEFYVRFAHERVPAGLGKPIAQTERIQSIAGEIDAQLFQAEELMHSIARRADAGDADAIARAPFVKLLATRSAVTAVQTAVQALGNPALSRHNPIERHLRDVERSAGQVTAVTPSRVFVSARIFASAFASRRRSPLSRLTCRLDDGSAVAAAAHRHVAERGQPLDPLAHRAAAHLEPQRELAFAWDASPRLVHLVN